MRVCCPSRRCIMLLLMIVVIIIVVIIACKVAGVGKVTVPVPNFGVCHLPSAHLRTVSSFKVNALLQHL